ncbi:MAG: hypothetical protein H6828_13040 [Planctomycetes bacterium]|nr:hypothetical protein [Planctomycetota bacterium]
MNLTKTLVAVLAGSAMTLASAQTGSDSCTTPDALAGQGSFLFDNTLATTGVEGQTESLCYAFGTSAMNNDVWFSWTADATGVATIDTCGATIDTRLASYPGGACPTAGSALACNDDACGLQSQITFAVTNGTAYMVQLGTFSAATSGTGMMNVLISQPPANDDCSAATVIAGQGSFAFDNTLASAGVQGQTEALCYNAGTSAVDKDVWFTWTADATGTATLSTCASGVNTKTAVYPGAGCPTAGTALACDTNCQLIMPVTNGTTYTVQLGTDPGAAGGAGTLDILIIPPVTNDDCAAPTAISGTGTFAFNQIGATTGAQGQTESICYFFGQSGVDLDVWYAWTSTFTGTAQVSTCNGATTDTKLVAYPGSGCPTAGSSIACNDDSCGLQSSISFSATNGSTYMIQLGSFPGGSTGTGTFDINQFVPQAGDDCSLPVVIAGQGTFNYDSTTATTGTQGQNEACAAINKDLWYTWTADATGPCTVSTCGLASYDTEIAAWPGVGCPIDGTSLDCNDDTCGLQSEINFNVVAGQSYTLQIGTFSAAITGGPASFNISIAGPAEPGTAFCFCDAPGSAPCGNEGNAGAGCQNSTGTGGAVLGGSGTALLGSDTVVLNGSGLVPNQPGLYFQGNNAINGGLGVVFGDGIRCAGQNVIRLGVRAADGSGNSSTTGITVSVKGGVLAGDLKHYQLWYRDPNGGAGGPCGNVFNLSNGYTIQW